MSYLDAREAHRLAQQSSATGFALLGLVNDAISGAATAGQFTVTYDVFGQLNIDIQFVMNSLRFYFYVVQQNIGIGTNTLVINW